MQKILFALACWSVTFRQISIVAWLAIIIINDNIMAIIMLIYIRDAEWQASSHFRIMLSKIIQLILVLSVVFYEVEGTCNMVDLLRNIAYYVWITDQVSLYHSKCTILQNVNAHRTDTAHDTAHDTVQHSTAHDTWHSTRCKVMESTIILFYSFIVSRWSIT